MRFWKYEYERKRAAVSAIEPTMGAGNPYDHCYYFTDVSKLEMDILYTILSLLRVSMFSLNNPTVH